jgi:hypothetical protein
VLSAWLTGKVFTGLKGRRTISPSKDSDGIGVMPVRGFVAVDVPPLEGGLGFCPSAARELAGKLLRAADLAQQQAVTPL